MREKHHGTQALLISRELIEALAQHLNQFVERGKDPMVQVFLSQFLPQMLDGVAFWPISRLEDQANIFWHLQIFARVPACLLDWRDDKVVAKVYSHRRQ